VQLYHKALLSVYSQIRILRWQNFGLNWQTKMAPCS
jgi:hypothetical protein